VSATVYSLPHIAGSAFALTLSTETSPISIAGEPDLDVFDWGVELVLMGKSTRVVVPGVWLSSVGPTWSISFGQDNTAAWTVGTHDVRLAFTSPEASGRRFEQAANLVLEVTR
jgi:hypothetical protein